MNRRPKNQSQVKTSHGKEEEEATKQQQQKQHGPLPVDFVSLGEEVEEGRIRKEGRERVYLF